MRRAHSMPIRPVIGALLIVLIAAALVIGWRHGLSLQALQQARHALTAHEAAHPFFFTAAFFLVYVAYASVALPGIGILSLAAGILRRTRRNRNPASTPLSCSRYKGPCP